jgi:hypothetical protein
MEGGKREGREEEGAMNCNGLWLGLEALSAVFLTLFYMRRSLYGN